MKTLFELIEKLLGGEYDMRAEKMIAATCTVERAAEDAIDELNAIRPKMGEEFFEALIDAGEAYDDGTPEEIQAYTGKVKELYGQIRAEIAGAVRESGD